LAGIQPGHHRLDGDHRGKLGGPLRPCPIADHPGKLAAGGGDHALVEPVHLLAELRLPGGVVERAPE
jgi:hypothetical protein